MSAAEGQETCGTTTLKRWATVVTRCAPYRSCRAGKSGPNPQPWLPNVSLRFGQRNDLVIESPTVWRQDPQVEKTLMYCAANASKLKSHLTIQMFRLPEHKSGRQDGRGQRMAVQSAVIAGAGSTRLPLALCLSRADPHVTVLKQGAREGACHVEGFQGPTGGLCVNSGIASAFALAARTAGGFHEGVFNSYTATWPAPTPGRAEGERATAPGPSTRTGLAVRSSWYACTPCSLTKTWPPTTHWRSP